MRTFTVLAPRLLVSMEILQLPIAELQAKIEQALQENPFLELEESPDIEPDILLKPDETGDLEFSRLEELNRDWEEHFNDDTQSVMPDMIIERVGDTVRRTDGASGEKPV